MHLTRGHTRHWYTNSLTYAPLLCPHHDWFSFSMRTRFHASCVMRLVQRCVNATLRKRCATAADTFSELRVDPGGFVDHSRETRAR
eukprot:m.1514998 g.1514998  ORF g.1514998 m.1514998 type:complete len:86 (-) comp25215_c0_seq18:3064-3321(-)